MKLCKPWKINYLWHNKIAWKLIMVIFLPSLSCGNVGATAPGYRKRERAVQLHAYVNNDYMQSSSKHYSTWSAARTEDLHLDMWFPKVLECGFVPASMTSPHPSQALLHFHINTCTICTCTLDWLLSCIEPRNLSYHYHHTLVCKTTSLPLSSVKGDRD